MKKALYFEKQENSVVMCKLCPNFCIIGEEEHGICNVRINHKGILYSEFFGKVASLGFDPIEKKPLYHFYPGSRILSVGTLGCNLKCKFCQNYRISQIALGEFENTKLYTPDQIVKIARESEGNIGIAFTYNEPSTFYEYMLEVSGIAKEVGLKTVMVTNGYINRKPLSDLLPFIDAFNVDIKAFSEGFYKEITQSHLAPVKKTIKAIAQSDSHLELTNLVIPGLNDDYPGFEEMVRWIAAETGERTVLHISRYFPSYHLQIEATPVNTMLDLYEIAKKHLKFVYLGNIVDWRRETTYCDQCNSVLITRDSYKTEIAGLDDHGDCIVCGNHVIDYMIKE